ncbi:hypothetical protein [Mobilicoccus pelagius]|nr:hypothetical protein [Mobilicoccus pelagius]
MAIGEFFSRLGGKDRPEAEPEVATPRAPTADDLRAALERAEALVDGASAPSVVAARVRRVTATVRDTLPRLEVVGLGSDQGYSVMATATDYLPEAVNGYLRLPRRFADTRPVDGPRTSLMVLVDQLDLLGATMDRVFDAVCRDDATALVAHARFLEDKFGHRSTGGGLDLAGAGAAIPAMPDEVEQPADLQDGADAVGEHGDLDDASVSGADESSTDAIPDAADVATADEAGADAQLPPHLRPLAPPTP